MPGTVDPDLVPVPTPKPWVPVPLCCWCTRTLVKIQLLGTLAWVCPSPPCYNRQLRFAMLAHTSGGTQRLLYLPLPRQTEAHEVVAAQKYRRLLYGGAAGGGKSKWIRWLAYQLCLQYPKLRVLILRRTWPELEETHIREAIMDAGEFGPDVMKVTPSNRLVEFPTTGSYIKFGHCQDDKDMKDYLSREYDLILFDELVTFTETQYLLISSRARNTRTDFAPMVVAGTNPGGPGAAWVSQLFREKKRDKKKFPYYDPTQHHFIRALLDDNPYVSESYVEFLMDLPEELREAYRWGNWDIFPGQYFKDFRAEQDGQPWHVREIQVPVEVPRLGGMDWGYLRPGVFLWAVVLPDDHLYIEQEYVYQEVHTSDIARNVILITKASGWELGGVWGDPSMAIRSGETGEDKFETLAHNGLSVLPGKHERVNGWSRLREWLKTWPDGRPGLMIHPRCQYLIRTLPQLMQDSTKLEDVDTRGEDHACLTGDTLVTTARGQVPLQQLSPSDTVLTRQGWYPVDIVACTSRSVPLLRIDLSNGRSLTGTANHPVWVETRGFVPLDALRYGDILSAWPATTTEMPDASGENTTAPAPSPPATRSTTRMETPRTTHSRIWNACPPRLTQPSTLEPTTSTSIWKRCGRWLRTGIAPLLVGSGIVRTPRLAGRTVSPCPSPVSSARRVSWTFLTTPASALPTVRLPHADSPVSMRHSMSVLSASGSTPPTATPAPSPVPEPAVRVVGSSLVGIGTVYNLTVAGPSEYYANGVLVSNCDALRYLVMSRPAPLQQRTETVYPPGSAGELLAELLAAQGTQVLGAHNVA